MKSVIWRTLTGHSYLCLKELITVQHDIHLCSTGNSLITVPELVQSGIVNIYW